MIKNRLNQLNASFKNAFLNYWCSLLICPALFLYIFSNDINLIALNGLTYRKICLNEFNLTICNSIHNYTNYSTRVQEISSQKLIILNVSFLIPAIFAIIYFASLGDRRLNYKLPLLVSIIGSFGQAFINIFAVNQTYSTCFNLLIFSQFLNGICGGGSLAFISSCFSHISIYEEKNSNDQLNTQLVESEPNEPNTNINKTNRSIRYSLCESCLLLGQFLGAFLSGYLIGNKIDLEKFKTTYIISFCIYLFVFVYLIIMFEYLKKRKIENAVMSLDTSAYINDLLSSQVDLEQKSEEIIVKKSEFSIRNQLNFLVEIWVLLTKKRQKNARFHIISLLVLFFFGSSISMGIISLQYLYIIKKPISFSQVDYGIYRALNTLFRAISLLIILPILKSSFIMPDHYLFILGLTSEFLNLIVFSTASYYKYIIWIGPLTYMFSNYYVVGIRSFVTKLVDKSETGKFFGIIGVVEFLVLLTSSSLFSFVYKATVSTFPSLVFLIGCAICVLFCYPFLIYFIRDLKKYHFENYEQNG